MITEEEEDDDDLPTFWYVFLLAAIPTYNNSIDKMDVLLVLHLWCWYVHIARIKEMSSL